MIITDEAEIKKLINRIRNFNNLGRQVDGNEGYSYLYKGKLYTISNSQLSPYVVTDSDGIFDEVQGVYKINHQELEDFMKGKYDKTRYKDAVTKIEVRNGIFSLETSIFGVEYESTITNEEISDFKQKLKDFMTILKSLNKKPKKTFKFTNDKLKEQWLNENPGVIYFNLKSGEIELEPSDKYSLLFKIYKKYLVKFIKSSKDPFFEVYLLDKETSVVKFTITNTKFTSFQLFKIINL